MLLIFFLTLGSFAQVDPLLKSGLLMSLDQPKHSDVVIERELNQFNLDSNNTLLNHHWITSQLIQENYDVIIGRLNALPGPIYQKSDQYCPLIFFLNIVTKNILLNPYLNYCQNHPKSKLHTNMLSFFSKSIEREKKIFSQSIDTQDVELWLLKRLYVKNFLEISDELAVLNNDYMNIPRLRKILEIASLQGPYIKSNFKLNSEEAQIIEKIKNKKYLDLMNHLNKNSTNNINQNLYQTKAFAYLNWLNGDIKSLNQNISILNKYHQNEITQTLECAAALKNSNQNEVLETRNKIQKLSSHKSSLEFRLCEITLHALTNNYSDVLKKMRSLCRQNQDQFLCKFEPSFVNFYYEYQDFEFNKDQIKPTYSFYNELIGKDKNQKKIHEHVLINPEYLAEVEKNGI